MQNRNSEQICQNGQGMSAVSFFLLGAAVGSAAALLFSPMSGRHLRARMGERVEEGRRAVKDQVRETWDKTSDAVKEAAALVDRGTKALVDEISL